MASSCEICSSPHDTQYCMENPEQAFVEYASSRADKAGVDMEREPTFPLLVGRGFLATANAVIDCKKAKITVGEGLTISIFGVRELDFEKENVPYWTTIDNHLPGEWEIARDAEVNPFKDILVFRKMVEFLRAIPINLKRNMWESEEVQLYLVFDLQVIFDEEKTKSSFAWGQANPKCRALGRHLEEMHMTWALFWKKQDKIATLHNEGLKICLQKVETASGLLTMPSG
ncbi:hypothetical protein Tco_0698323 [Tanacetum coccineum]